MTPITFEEAVRLFREYYALTDCTQIRPGMEETVERAENLILKHKPRTLAEAAEILAVIMENSQEGSGRASLNRVQKFLAAASRVQSDTRPSSLNPVGAVGS